jgi:hypothetical protein
MLLSQQPSAQVSPVFASNPTTNWKLQKNPFSRDNNDDEPLQMVPTTRALRGVDDQDYVPHDSDSDSASSQANGESQHNSDSYSYSGASKASVEHQPQKSERS